MAAALFAADGSLLGLAGWAVHLALGWSSQLVVGDLGHGRVVVAAAAVSVSVVVVLLAVGGERPELAGLVVLWHWWICPGLLHV